MLSRPTFLLHKTPPCVGRIYSYRNSAQQRPLKGLSWSLTSHRGLLPRSKVQPRGAAPHTEASTSLDLAAVLFDMDGVLCDSEALSARAAVECFKENYAVDATVDDFIELSGRGETIYLGKVAEKYKVDNFEIDDCRQSYYQVYGEKYALPEAGIGFPGALELVKSCKAEGWKIALASSADRIKVEANLVAAGIPIDIFDEVVTGSDGLDNLKPAPDIFLEAAKRLDVNPGNCIVIEDSRPGVQAAKAAGMSCLAVTTTLPREELLEMSVEAIFTDISQVSTTDLSSAFDQKKEASSHKGGWLDATINLPGGYKITRRSSLQFANLGLLGVSAYMLFSRAKAMSFTSPKALVNALGSLANREAAKLDGDRVGSFRNYIANLEKKGGGETVPDFPEGVDWFNSRPLKWNRELQGKIVVLDFWTYCCINCMHVLPDLAAIEARFAGKPVAVVGVHSAKFDNEKDSEAIRNAVLRYDVEHPVLNDGNMKMWKGLGVSSWPTLAVVGPRGNLLLMLTGEKHLDDMEDIITAALDFYGKRDLLDNQPLPLDLERNKDTRQLQSQLRFPGKIASDLEGGRLFISDSNNHRIVVCSLEGQFIDHIGGNGLGFADGTYESCAFNRPQGVAFDPQKNTLYVADTENHALRAVDLSARVVTTLAGNGYQGRDYRGGGVRTDQQLSSPWDVELDAEGANVFIALAGQHQIWKHELESGVTRVFSGNGYERNKNGEDGKSTSWAQPSGLTLSSDGKHMFVADSESSSIRKVDLTTGGSKACVGGDSLFADNLFRFGDKDGEGALALLQHPLGVCQGDDGKVYVTDSYNHRVKVLDPASNSIVTLAGSGVGGYRDGNGQGAQLSEPGGLAKGRNGSFLVADTNNNLIRVLKNGKVTTIDLKGVPKPRVSPLESLIDDDRAEAPGKVITTKQATTTFGDINISVDFPPGFNFTKGAASKFSVRVSGPSSSDILVSPTSGRLDDLNGSLQLQYTSSSLLTGLNKIQLDTKLYYCEEGEACLFEEVRVEVGFASSLEHGASSISATIRPSAAAPVADFDT